VSIPVRSNASHGRGHWFNPSIAHQQPIVFVAFFSLQQLRGVGPIIATALIAAMGDGAQFTKGRDFAVSLGLTPRQHSTGGKERMLGISKRGEPYLRSLLVHGGRSALYAARNKEDRLSLWVKGIAARRHPNVAAVAWANKTARIAWAVVAQGSDYEPQRAN
jgi:transposase